jgi:hypothetical protein
MMPKKFELTGSGCKFTPMKHTGKINNGGQNAAIIG